MLDNVLNTKSSNCTPISSSQFVVNTNFIWEGNCSVDYEVKEDVDYEVKEDVGQDKRT